MAGASAASGTGAAGGATGSGGAGGGGGTGGGAPVDCGAIAANPSWKLCASTSASCSAVFSDGAGCAAVCASVGLVCSEVHEDLTGACAPDTSKPALSCSAPTGHQSDYCVCRPSACAPSCAGKPCGADDGCGGSCGCPAGQTCTNGSCGPGVAEDCTKYPFKAETLLAERVGYGRNATGGDPQKVYHVKTLADGGAGSLRAALESTEPYWIVFDVSGKIVHKSGRVDVRSNKTVDGRGRDVTVEGELRLTDTQNVIISDVRLTNTLETPCTQAGDVLLVRGKGGTDPSGYTSKNIWVHHVDLVRGGDGLFDVRGGSLITVSWTRFAEHKKGLLNWRTSDDQPAPGMRITYHHDFFDRISLRGPQFVFGRAHYFNNYQYQWYEYGAGSLGGAQFLSEANVYEARPGDNCPPIWAPSCPDPNPCGDSDFAVSKAALVTDWDTNGTGYTKSVGDLLLNGAVLSLVPPPGGAFFDPKQDYSYTPDVAAPALAAQIKAQAGPRKAYCK
jgi:pectate lyase